MEKIFLSLILEGNTDMYLEHLQYFIYKHSIDDLECITIRLRKGNNG